MRRPLTIAAIVGLVLGGIAFTLIWLLTPKGGWHTPPPGDRVQHAIDALRQDHVYVGPEERWRFTDAQIADVEKAAKRAPVPTYVVYWDGYDGDWGVTIDNVALDQIKEAIPGDAYFVMADATNGAVQTDARGYEPPFSGDLDNPARPGPSLVSFLDDLGDPEPPWDEDEMSVADGFGQGAKIGISVGGGVAVVVFVVGLARDRSKEQKA